MAPVAGGATALLCPTCGALDVGMAPEVKLVAPLLEGCRDCARRPHCINCHAPIPGEHLRVGFAADGLLVGPLCEVCAAAVVRAVRVTEGALYGGERR